MKNLDLNIFSLAPVGLLEFRLVEVDEIADLDGIGSGGDVGGRAIVADLVERYAGDERRIVIKTAAGDDHGHAALDLGVDVEELVRGDRLFDESVLAEIDRDVTVVAVDLDDLADDLGAHFLRTGAPQHRGLGLGDAEGLLETVDGVVQVADLAVESGDGGVAFLDLVLGGDEFPPGVVEGAAGIFEVGADLLHAVADAAGRIGIGGFAEIALGAPWGFASGLT